MAHSVFLLGAIGARGRGGGVWCCCWAGLLIRCRCWAGAAAEGEGAVDAGLRLVLLLGSRLVLMVSNAGTGDRELRWLRRCGLLKAVTRRGLAINGCDRR
jgi:hypothetical protein